MKEEKMRVGTVQHIEVQMLRVEAAILRFSAA
jgi:hypothetical protein